MTSRAAWTRLFDETITELRFDVDGEALSLEPTLNLLQDSPGRAAPQGRRGPGHHAVGPTCGPLR